MLISNKAAVVRSATLVVMDDKMCTGYREQVRGRGWTCLALGALISISGLGAQVPAPVAARTEVSAGSELETYLRTLQAVGIIGVYPWSARRFTAAEVDRLLPADSGHPWANRYDWHRAPARGLSMYLDRPEAASRFNTTLPYGYNDEAVWAGRGVTLTAQGGGGMRYGPLAISLVPLVSWASNNAFNLQHNGQTGPVRYGDGRYATVIDHPQRFGDHPFALASWGQSTAEISKWGVATGVSAANDYWGPASDFPIILGNNADGYPHVFVGTAAPIDLYLVRIHIRATVGRLTQSAYSPQLGEPAVRAGSGAVLVVTPRSPRGLEFGATRFIHHPWAGWGAVPEELRAIFQFNATNHLLENQLASVFFRWVVPKGGVEVYGEYGSDDYRFNLREIFVEPDHIAGYTIGLRRVIRQSQGGLRVIRAEIMNVEQGTLVQSRPQAPFYVHTSLRQGHTNRGQILGSEWGVGGAAAKVAIDWYRTNGRLTIAWSRLLRGEANDSVATMPQNPRGLDVMHTLGVERLFFRGRYDILTGVTAVYEFNRDFRADAFNLNAIVSVRTAIR